MSDHTGVTALPIANAAARVRHVFVRDLALQAEIGVHPHEQHGPQPIRVNVDLTVSEAGPPHLDMLEGVVCYERVVDEIREVIASGHVKLVETLAEMIAERCLDDRRVLNARVRVEKLAVIPGAASVGIEIDRPSPWRDG